MALRATLAGALAFLASLVAELGVLAVIGNELVMAIGVAPVLEEVAKRLAMLALGAAWSFTGLAFGVIEGGLKLGEWHALGLAGALASVLQHWAYGRWAERLGLWVAILLHMAFNGSVILADLALGEAALWYAPVAALLLLAASLRKIPLDRPVDGGAARP